MAQELVGNGEPAGNAGRNQPSPPAYDGWSREALVERLRSLEAAASVPVATATPTCTTNTKPPANLGTLRRDNPATRQQQPGKRGGKKGKKKRAGDRPFDFAGRRYRHIALKVAYLGYDYYGLASQPTDTVETIESALFHALRTIRLVPEDAPPRAWSFSRCGRTDRGVSSFGQVVGLRVRSALTSERVDGEETGTFPWPGAGGADSEREDAVGAAIGGDADGNVRNAGDGDEDHDANGASLKRKADRMEEVEEVVGEEEDLQAALAPSADEPPAATTAGPRLSARILEQELDYPHLLNNVLPPDIRVLAWAPVSPTFDARFSCTSRRYKYFFVRNALDIPAMERAASKLQGVDLDYRNFCKPDLSKRTTLTTFRRSIAVARIVLESRGSAPGGGGSQDVYCFEVVGSAFLWHQVRCMMAVLFRVGQGLERPEVVDELLDMSLHPGKVGRPAYEMASEIPLSLVECGYARTPFQWVCRPRSRGMVCRELRQQQDDLAIRMAHLASLLHEVQAASGPCVPVATAVDGEEEDVEQAMQCYTVSPSMLSETSHPDRYVALMERRRCAPLTPFVRLPE